MTRARPRAWTRRIAFTTGLALAAAAVLSLQVTNGSEPLGANVTVSAIGNGELSVAQQGPFLSARQLPPGMSAGGDVRLVNQTGATLGVRVRAMSPSRDLDQRLDVRLAAGQRELFSGRLAELRSWTREELRLAPTAAGTLRVRASLPEGVRGHEGRTADLKLEFDSRPLRSER